MKLICAVTYVSLYLLQAECARLVGFRKENYVPTNEHPIESDDFPREEDNCCHLPKDKQSCSCCSDACPKRRQSVLPGSTCCHLPKAFQTCTCCPSACPVIPSALYNDCCHLPQHLISCKCCSLACLPRAPPMLQLPPMSLLPVPLLPIPDLLPLSQPVMPTSCCHLPKPFVNCDCCPSACNTIPYKPINESCCHWPSSLQSCICCASACKTTSTSPEPEETTEFITTTDIETSTKDASDPCCDLLDKLKNCNCCSNGCKKDLPDSSPEPETTTIIPTFTTETSEISNDCCHFPKNMQNCNCCPKLCQTASEYTETTVTNFPSHCCNLPADQQSCSCCPDACEKEGKTTPSISTATVSPAVGTDTKVNCCHLPREFRTCRCCPGNCDAPVDLLTAENCCNWPKLLQRCSCCPFACQYLQYPSRYGADHCCYAPLDLQDCQCCPFSLYCRFGLLGARSEPSVDYLNLQMKSADAVSSDYIRTRHMRGAFDHRPETYLVRPGNKNSIVGTRRTMSPPNFDPLCVPPQYTDSSPLEMHNADYGDYFKQLSTEARRAINIPKRNFNVYDFNPRKTKYPGNKQRNFGRAMLSWLRPYISPTKYNINYRNIFLPDINYEDTDNNVVEPNVPSAVPEHKLHMLINKVAKTPESYFDDVIPMLSADKINPESIFRSHHVTIPGLIRNLMKANRKYKDISEPPIEGVNVGYRSDSIEDGQSYDFINRGVRKRRESLSNRELIENDKRGTRYSHYYPIHLAAPVASVKQLLTRIARGCNPIQDRWYFTPYNFDQQLFDANPADTITANARRYTYDDYNNQDYQYDYDNYGDDPDDYENEVNSNPVAVAGNGKFMLIRSSDSPLELKTQLAVAVPSWDNNSSINELIGSGMNPSSNLYRTNEADAQLDTLMKLYSIPPTKWYRHNVLDYLAKLATGVEANHGETEFQPMEDGGRRMLQSSLISSFPSALFRQAPTDQNALRDKLNTEIVDIIEWLNTLDKEKRFESSRKTYPSYLEPSFERVPFEVNPSRDSTDFDTDNFYNDLDDNFYQESELSLRSSTNKNPPSKQTTHEDEEKSYFVPQKLIDFRKSKNFLRQALTADENNWQKEVMSRGKRATDSFQNWLRGFKHFNQDTFENVNGPVKLTKRQVFHNPDRVMGGVFHTLKSLRSLSSLRDKRLVLRSLPRNQRHFAALSNWYFNNEDVKKRQKYVNSLLRRLTQSSLPVGQPSSSKRSNVRQNRWPIEYGINNPKRLNLPIFIPSSPFKKNKMRKMKKNGKKRKVSKGRQNNSSIVVVLSRPPKRAMPKMPSYEGDIFCAANPYGQNRRVAEPQVYQSFSVPMYLNDDTTEDNNMLSAMLYRTVRQSEKFGVPDADAEENLFKLKNKEHAQFRVMHNNFNGRSGILASPFGDLDVNKNEVVGVNVNQDWDQSRVENNPNRRFAVSDIFNSNTEENLKPDIQYRVQLNPIQLQNKPNIDLKDNSKALSDSVYKILLPLVEPNAFVGGEKEKLHDDTYYHTGVQPIQKEEEAHVAHYDEDEDDLSEILYRTKPQLVEPDIHDDYVEDKRLKPGNLHRGFINPIPELKESPAFRNDAEVSAIRDCVTPVPAELKMYGNIAASEVLDGIQHGQFVEREVHNDDTGTTFLQPGLISEEREDGVAQNYAEDSEGIMSAQDSRLASLPGKDTDDKWET